MSDDYTLTSGNEKYDEEIDYDDSDVAAYRTVKDAVLFAIEVNESMITPLPTPPGSKKKHEDLDTPTSAALKCAYRFVQQRIISNPGDMMGILFFGTEKSRFEDGNASNTKYPHCYLLNDLNIPSVDDVRELKELVEDEEAFNEVLVPSKEPVSIAHVLYCANDIFITRAPNFSSRRLFIVSDNDDPNATDKEIRNSAAVRAKDLYDLGVIIELFPISTPSHSFDRTKFYDDIIYSNSPLDPDAPAPLTPSISVSSSTDGITLLSSLLSNINSKAIPRRAAFSLHLSLAPKLRISVKGYHLFKRQLPSRSCYIYLQGEKAQIVEGRTTQMAEDDTHTVTKTEIQKAYKFGGETVTFTQEELTSLRNFGEPIIRIIGFKSLSLLPIWATVKDSIFIYPTEESFVGSTRVFSALWTSLLKSEKFALVWFIARRNAAPVLAALLPSRENTTLSTPQGLYLLTLPFADDVRAFPPSVGAPAKPPNMEIVDKLRPVIENLSLPKGKYDPARYPNPALQWHYKILQALALDEDVPTTPEDKTIPKWRAIDRRAGGYLEQWKQMTEEMGRKMRVDNWKNSIEEDEKYLKKRGSSDEAVPNQKTKKELTDENIIGGNGDLAMTDREMRIMYQTGTINKLTIPVLSAYLKSKGLPLVGRKSDLVQRIAEYFDQ